MMPVALEKLKIVAEEIKLAKSKFASMVVGIEKTQSFVRAKRAVKKLAAAFLSAFLLFLIVSASINIYMVCSTRKFVYDSISDLPPRYTVIIPGARVYRNNVSFVVRDRIEGGAECVKSGKGERILISGDHGRKDYDEVNQMRKYMQKIYGIDGGIIFLDHAGFSTYETMYRARDVFRVGDAVIVTQKFHTARAVYIARKMGIDAVAYAAPELNPFSARIHASWAVREYLARVKNFFLVLFDIPPTYLGEEIPIVGDASKSWDEIE